MAIRRVPAEYPSIQQAVDAAAPGDTVTVEAGSYAEAVTVGPGRDRLRIEGAPTGEVILDGGGQAETGFRITGSGWVTVRRFTVTGSAGPGVVAETPDGVFRDVNVHHCAGHGYSLRPGAHRTLVLDATIRENGGDGIQAEGAGCTVMRCDIAGNAGTGVAILADGALLFDNTVEGNSGDGIAVGSHGNRLIGNDSLANLGTGIALEAGDLNLVLANDSADNESEGVLVRTGGNRILDNPVSGNDAGGIRLVDTADGNLLDDNLVEVNGGPGILLEGGAADNAVRGNTALGNALDDLQAEPPADGRNALDANEYDTEPD